VVGEAMLTLWPVAEKALGPDQLYNVAPATALVVKFNAEPAHTVLLLLAVVVQTEVQFIDPAGDTGQLTPTPVALE
jgi:hypothetical protein